MTITARWAELEPGTVIGRADHEMTVATPEDARALVGRLARPHTSEAHLTHRGRPTRPSPLLGDLRPDHKVVIAVWQGYGYMEYIDPTHWSQLVGEPATPEWHTTTSEHFGAGSGVRLDTLVDAVTEFLTTGQRPTTVAWREQNHHHSVPNTRAAS
jgi:hypothetical protein